MRDTAIKVVTLDLWGTLLLDGPAAGERYRRERLARVRAALAEQGAEVTLAALIGGYEESGRQLLRVWRTWRDVPVERHVILLLQAVDAALPARLGLEAARGPSDAGEALLYGTASALGL